MYPAPLTDALDVKTRDGQAANRPVYAALGINCAGERDVPGLWAGTGGEGAKAWTGMPAELRNRGVQDMCIVACDGLKGPARSHRRREHTGGRWEAAGLAPWQAGPEIRLRSATDMAAAERAAESSKAVARGRTEAGDLCAAVCVTQRAADVRFCR